MRLSKEAINNKPKKPLSPYLAFRNEKMATYKDDSNKTEKIKADWTNLDNIIMADMYEKYYARY